MKLNVIFNEAYMYCGKKLLNNLQEHDMQPLGKQQKVSYPDYMLNNIVLVTIHWLLDIQIII